jgi:hypothetical protein
MIEKLDAASRRWYAPFRWLYLTVTWTLVCLGALFLWLSFCAKANSFFWGSMFIVLPFLHGCAKGLQEWRQRSA